MSLTRGTTSASPLHEGAALGVGNHQLHGGDGQALAHAAALVHFLVFARGEGHLLHNLAHVLRNFDRRLAALGPSLLRGDGDALFQRLRIVRANLRADAVLERRDDFAARRVVLRIGAEDQRHIQLHAHRIAFDLHVALLHDVEQRHLNFAGKVGQLVDGEEAAIGAGQQAIVHGELAGKVLARRAPP